MAAEIRGVLFDAGNTLVFVDPRRVVPCLVEAGAVGAAERYRDAEREARLAMSRALLEPGPSEDILWSVYFRTLFELCGVPAERTDAAAAAVRGALETDHIWTHVNEGTAEAIRRVRALGYRVGVVSNSDGRVAALLERLGLAEHVEFVIDSGTVGVMKPDPRIFLMGTERLGLPPEEVLYVGDLYAVDVLGARAAGLVPLLLDPFDRFGHLADVARIATVEDLPGWLERRAAS